MLSGIVRPYALALLLVAPPAAAQSATVRAPAGWAAFAGRFDSYAAAEGIVGGSALLLLDGKVAARHRFGYADLSSRRPVTDRTIFHWASVTKTLTGIAIMQLRDRGLLSLDDPVTRWIPELRRVHADRGQMDSVTIGMLLSHSSGLQHPTWPWGGGESWEPFEPTEWAQLVAMMPYQRLHFPPGSRFGYSNPGYVHLARVVEEITGDPWAVYVQKNLWTPLGLTRSYVGTTPYHLAADRSHGYRIGDTLTDAGADFDPGVTIPNSGWNAPLDDLAGYLRFLLGAAADTAERRRFDAVLSRRSLAVMWRPRLPTGRALPELSRMGLAFFSTEVGGRRIVGHTGDQAGYRSYVYLDPVRRAALVMVFNTTRDESPREARLAALAREGIALLR